MWAQNLGALKNVVLGKFEYLNALLTLFLDASAVEGKANDIKTSLDEDYNDSEYNVYDMDGHDSPPGPGRCYINIIKLPLLKIYYRNNFKILKLYSFKIPFQRKKMKKRYVFTGSPI